MKKSKKFSPKVIERAARVVQGEPAAARVAMGRHCFDRGQIGCTAETLRRWVRQHETDTGQRLGLSTQEQQGIKELERESRGLWRMQVWTVGFRTAQTNPMWR